MDMSASKEELAKFGYLTRDEELNYLQEVSDICIRNTKKYSDSEEKVLNFLHPEELSTKIDISLRRESSNPDEMKSILEKVFKFSVHTMSPNFYQQLFYWGDCWGIGGQWVAEILNTSAYTYEMSPVFTIMEKEVIKEALKLWNFPSTGEGYICHGGAQSMLFALNVARNQYYPQVKTKGASSMPNVDIYTSEEGHYSLEKSASIIGIGSESIVPVETDDLGIMKMDALKAAISKTLANGRVPFYINATAGTTVTDAYDPINEIANLCEKHRIWLNIDGAFGGSLIFSNKHRHLLKGAHRANSVVWDFHKMLGAPLPCSVLLLRESGQLKAAQGISVGYLFAGKKHYDVDYDLGNLSIQCGRKIDNFKVWMAWKARGSNGFEAHVDKLYENAEYFLNKIKSRDDFRLVFPKAEPRLKICFWYLPPWLQKKTLNEEDKKYLNAVTHKIKEVYVYEGLLYLATQPLKKHPFFFRIVIIDPRKGPRELDRVISIFSDIGSKLKKEDFNV
uniref:Glutamate decarboxylase 2 n=1 Tax=Hofstenia miamia TaxID=442651 RepID=A0A7G7LK81_HOFMI|nr:glutamate decarboxylase 2 [Hofstenia miamia]